MTSVRVCSLELQVVNCLAQYSSRVLFDTFIKGHTRKSEKRERERERESGSRASDSKSSAKLRPHMYLHDWSKNVEP